MIPKEILKKVKRIEIQTRGLVNDVLSGEYHSVFKGRGMEFSEAFDLFATRNPKEYGLDDLQDLISFGASPRASIYLHQAAKAHAFLRRRGYVVPEDIRAIGMDVLRHRILVTYEAEAEEITPEDVVRKVLNKIEVP